MRPSNIIKQLDILNQSRVVKGGLFSDLLPVEIGNKFKRKALDDTDVNRAEKYREKLNSY